jgi:DNA-binding NtrC family response regulator
VAGGTSSAPAPGATTQRPPPRPGSLSPGVGQAALCVRVVKALDLGRFCELGAAKIAIGSAPNNALCLSDRHVSRQHCEIFMRGHHCVIRDLGSTNGTFVDGAQVHEAVLSPISRVLIGTTELALHRLGRVAEVTVATPDAFGDMVGRSRLMQHVFGALQSVARSSLACLLLGEPGTGKEIAARALHDRSDRARKPFVAVDCAAASAQLLEAKFFGYVRGAFAGASHQQAAGAFEEARGGTVFLDEIGELPVELQSKLLSVLEQREASRLGSDTPVKLDFRLVAATHRNLPELARRGSFRQDLLYRISEFTVRIPSLRERKEDIALLAEAVLRREGFARMLTGDGIEYLQELPWPGNVRELRNLMRRAAVLAPTPRIDRELLSGLDAAITSEIQLPDELIEDVSAGVRRSAALSAAPGSTAPAGVAPGAAGNTRAPDRMPEASSGPTTLVPGASDQHAFDLPMAEATEAFRKAYLQHLRDKFGSDLEGAALHAGMHPKSVQQMFRIYGIS